MQILEFRSEPFRGREHSSVFLSGIPKNRNKLSECCSEPFRGRETNSEQNAAAEYFNNSVRKDYFWCTDKSFCTVTLLLLVKVIFSAEFHSVPFRSIPSFGIGYSAELGMPRNECFLPRNNGNHSESIIFSERNSVPNPSLLTRRKTGGGGRGWLLWISCICFYFLILWFNYHLNEWFSTYRFCDCTWLYLTVPDCTFPLYR